MADPNMPDIRRLQDMTWHLRRYARWQMTLLPIDVIFIIESRIKRLRKAQRKALRRHFGYDPLEKDWGPELTRACEMLGWTRWRTDEEALHEDASADLPSGSH